MWSLHTSLLLYFPLFYVIVIPLHSRHLRSYGSLRIPYLLFLVRLCFFFLYSFSSYLFRTPFFCISLTIGNFSIFVLYLFESSREATWRRGTSIAHGVFLLLFISFLVFITVNTSSILVQHRSGVREWLTKQFIPSIFIWFLLKIKISVEIVPVATPLLSRCSKWWTQQWTCDVSASVIGWVECNEPWRWLDIHLKHGLRAIPDHHFPYP